MTESEASTPITPTTINATTTPTTPTTPITSMPRSDLVTNGKFNDDWNSIQNQDEFRSSLSATTTNHNNNNLKSINSNHNHVDDENDDKNDDNGDGDGVKDNDNYGDECICQKITPIKETAICSRCARIIPFLANLHKECLEQREKLEVADKQITEGTAKAEEQTSYINKLNKTIEELEDQIDIKTDRYNDLERKMEALKQDMEILNEKYVDEIDKVAELQHSKDIVEGEVEELTKALFEKANDMVAVIGKDKHKLEVQHKLLEKQLAETQERLAAESSQLNELREKLEQTMQHQQQSQPESKRSSSSDPSFRASIDFAELFGLRERAPEAAATLPNPTGEDGIGIDNELLLEFKEFVSQSNSIRLQKIHTILFMRHCLEDDVDPCMRFGSNSRVSSRRIVDAIVSNTCFIEEAPQGSEKEQYLITNPSPIRNSASKQLLWERLSGNNSKTTGCQCCGRSGPLQFNLE